MSYLRKLDVKLWADGNRLGYSAPKGTLTPALRAELAEHKAGILAFLQKARVATSSTLPPITPRRSAGDLPLSFAQERLWFIDQLEPTDTGYNIPAAVRLTGSLDTLAVEHSLAALLERHATFRSSFAMADGQLRQLLTSTVNLTVPVINLQTIPEALRPAEVQRLATQESQQRFDLGRAPLIRAKLLRLDEKEHVLLVTMHHIVGDGWSYGIFWREFAVLYNSFANGKPAPLPVFPIQYADFAAWQREWLQGEVLAAQLSYWKQQLAGAPQVLELPTDHPRPTLPTHKGARQSHVVPQRLAQSLQALSQRTGNTLFMTLLAAFTTLLYRYSGQKDILVGSPIANRNSVEIEGLIGCFVNTLALRVDSSGNPTFEQLLRRVRHAALEAYAHQDLPFEKLVDVLQPERELNRHPLFQVMFVLNKPTPIPELDGLIVQPIEVEKGTARFDLILFMTDDEEGLRGLWEYKTDLFDPATIARMQGHFQTLLEGIVSNPDQAISDLPLLTQAEKQQLLVNWNGTEKYYPKNKCIHQLFEEQVERTPEFTAVVFENQQLTYRQLNRRANQLARYLKKRGVGPDTLVGISMERSLDLIVGLLGILKANGAYVPLDPEYPNQRLAFILEDTQTAVLLTHKGLILNLPNHSAQLVCLDSDWTEISKESEENCPVEATADNLAYVIYTSGSTGSPKGVEVVHRGIVRLLFGVDYVALDAQQTFLQLAPVSFDASTFEIWGALLYGAKCVLAPGKVPTPIELGRLLRQYKVSTLWLTSSLFNRVIDENPSALSEINQLLIGGEALSVAHVRRACNLLPNTELINAYGPTETTTFACCSLVVRELDPSIVSIPIGRPIANTKVYLLDSNLTPVPIGVTGELYIGGDGLARGYIRLPDLTAQQFIPDPFSSEPGARLYKTGDLGRYLADGNIDLLGRIDDQVKIRGFRIELGEVEAIVDQHPAVRQAVVLAREDQAGDPSAPHRTGKRLVAYVVPSERPALSIHELRSFLKQKLPEYMIPSVFVVMASLPLTPNGKVDRKALPGPNHSRPELEEGFAAPRTLIEELLTAIWSEVLKLDQVGIHDNFFDLGGHSLLAMQVVSRIHGALQAELALRTLFESPTIASLAQRIDEGRRTQQEMRTLPIVRVIREGAVPLSFAQQRLWFLHQLEPGSAVYNVPSAVRIIGSLDAAALEQSINEIVKRHEALRTTFSMADGEPLQVISPALRLCLPIVDVTHRPDSEREEEAQWLAREEAKQPFDSFHGPLVRTKLIRLGEEHHLLIVTIHHIVCDGWSMTILYRELSALYRAFTNEESSPLPNLDFQYADYTVWQRKWFQGEVLDSGLKYWSQQLENISTLQLPTDRPRPAVQSLRGARQSIELSDELSHRLKALSRKEDVTLFMTLFAAFQTLLHRYSGQDDIVVGSPIAGRNRQELEVLIGFFVNTLPLRTDFSGNPSFREVLRRVREVALEAYANQHVPFEKLVEDIHPERNLSHAPLFQVMFVLQNAFSTAFEIEGFRGSPVMIETDTTKFDLTLSMHEERGALRGSLEYSTDLFNSTTIQRMLGHLEVLLAEIIVAPDRRVSDLAILTSAERHQLLVQWNDTATHAPRHLCINELFEKQVEKSPDAIAVVFEHQQLTYRELNQQANQLARYLRRLGVGTDVLVGICVERSLEMIIGLLGVFKAGAAYVPFDPASPMERIAFMLEDAQMPVLLTHQRLLATLPAHSARLVCLDTDCVDIGHENQANLGIEATPETLAYVIYTSGSTGKPKGVIVSQGALVSHSCEVQRLYGLTSADCVLQFTSFSSDASVEQIVPTLTSGGTLVLRGNEVWTPEQFLQKIYDSKITVVELPTAYWQEVVEVLKTWGGAPPELLLRLVVVGGEAMPLEVVKVWQRTPLRHIRLVNAYGPTETTITATTFEIGGQLPLTIRAPKVPIGRPLGGRKIYILDQYTNPVPVGIPGELYIGGSGLGRGYLNRPDLTAEKFIPNPFSDELGSRLYKTGDLACYLPEGDIVLLGRIDHQVKIRGFRIELGEIESTLAQHPDVRQVIVVVREDLPNDKRLVAYVVLENGRTVAMSDLRDFLRLKLPEYMVPSAYVLLDAFPKTPAGKVDRRALPVPGRSVHASKEDFVAPRDDLERQLANIWERILGVQPVGVNDNFFDLGGHSLLAVRVMSHVEKSFGKKLPLMALFQAPRIEELAKRLRDNLSPCRWSCLVPIQPRGSKPPFFWIHGEASDAFLPNYLGPDQPLYGLMHQSEDGERARYTSVEDIAAYYLSEIRKVQPHGDYYLGGYCFGGMIAFEIAQQIRKQNEEVGLLFLLDPSGPSNGRLSDPLPANPVGFSNSDTSFRNELFRHLQNMRRLRPQERVSYLLRRVMGKAREWSPGLFRSASGKLHARCIWVSAGLYRFTFEANTSCRCTRRPSDAMLPKFIQAAGLSSARQ